jgi:hypothetical protein
MTQQRTCTATTKDGAPCRMRPTRGETCCFNHQPGLDARRAEVRSAAGKARQARAAAQAELASSLEPKPHWWPLLEPWHVTAAVAHTTRELITGKMEPKRGAVLTKALWQLARLVEEYDRADDFGDGSDFAGNDGADDEDDLDEADA